MLKFSLEKRIKINNLFEYLNINLKTLFIYYIEKIFNI